MTYEVNFNNQPTPPFRHHRGGSRKKPGCLGFWSAIPTDAKVKIGLMLVGLVLSFACAGWWVFRPLAGKAEEPPTPAVEKVQTVGPLEESPTDTPVVVTATSAQAGADEPPDLERTATFQAAISRPAVDPGSSPYFIGVITYEDGCLVSNLGFTTSGYHGKPYYLYLSDPLDRDPAMQMVQLRGHVQRFDTCQYPVLFVDQLFWLDQAGTPSPLSLGGPLTTTLAATGTITATLTPPTWGVSSQAAPTKTPTYTVWVPPQKNLPTPEPLPTYTPRPTYTPQPVQSIVQTVMPHMPTFTPFPTWTPDPATATPTETATPQPVNISGPVVLIIDCPLSNFAIQASPGNNYLVILDGAGLPPSGSPVEYTAFAIGTLADNMCGSKVIKASQIIWTLLPTPSPTDTATPTPTFTPTLTPTATLTATATITP